MILPPERHAGKDSWLIGVAVLISLAFMAVLMAPHAERALHGANDFAPLYTGSRLLQTGDLYNHEKLLETAANLTGMSSPDQGYIRLPFHAALLWPLSRLPYRTAYLIWILASLSAVVAFVALWRPPHASIVLLFTCLSVPVFAALLNGQDSTFLLLFVALSAALLDRSRPFAAGLVWSLCAIKFHLFLLTPIFILARRQWRFARGLLAGGAVLAAVSFAVAGWAWPLEFYASATNPAFSPSLQHTPTLHGILASVPGGLVLEILLSASMLAAVWLACRYSDQRLALAATLAGGFLLSVHAYLPDLSLLLPAALTAMALAQTRLARLAALALLTPPVHLSVTQGLPYSAIAVGLTLVLVYGLAREARAQMTRQRHQDLANTPSS